jgi:predicted Rossmann fold nucleotide-binding protein DprA/Smf involved in DNA uptake
MQTVREFVEADRDKSANVQKTQQVSFDAIAKDRYEAVKRQNAAFELTGDEKTVFNAMKNAFESIDEISDNCKLESKKVLVALTMLEMKGLVVGATGKRYKQK